LIKSSPRDHGIDADTWTVRAARELVRRRNGVREDKVEVKIDPELRVHNAMMKWRKVFLDLYGEFITASNESRKMRRTCVDYLRSEAEEFWKIADDREAELKIGGNDD